MPANTDSPTPTPQVALTSVPEVDRILAEHRSVLPVERVPLGEAQGRVLRQEVRAERESPPFHRAAMDGICVAASALARGQSRFAVAGCQRAGDPASRLPSPDVCMEIMTGAVVPEGAAMVIRIEDVAMSGGGAAGDADGGGDGGDGSIATLRLDPDAIRAIPAMHNIHQRGSDHPADTLLLAPGRVLQAPQIAILASCGVAQVAVAAWPRVAVIATGDELVGVDAPLAPHQIRMSNVYAVAAALRQMGLCDVATLHLKDDLPSLQRDIGRLLASHDVLVFSGGVSAGKFDYIPQVLREHGVELHVTRVQQRPGKPFTFGTRAADGRSVFALPGNPVSTLVCLRRYVQPTLLAAAGLSPNRALKATLTRSHAFKPRLTLFLPVQVSPQYGGLHATPMPTNGSGDWATLGETDGFVEIPPDGDETPEGAVLPFFPWACPPMHQDAKGRAHSLRDTTGTPIPAVY